MKLLISLILMVLSSETSAKVIAITHHPLQRGEAQHIGERLSSRYNIPAEFIELVEETNPCRPKRSRVGWHVCVDLHGNLQEVAVDPRFKEETLRIYL